jgi:hypothetical protein
MNPVGNAEPGGRSLTTADLAAAGRQPAPEAVEHDEGIEKGRTGELAVERKRSEGDARERLDALFAPELARDYRSRWAAVQSSFVDDPKRAVQQGDELVAQMMKSLAESFAAERTRLEAQLSQTGDASTETLRVSLRRYRSFFERLLSL